jgi:autophagy-related protein 9
MEQFFLTQ